MEECASSSLPHSPELPPPFLDACFIRKQHNEGGWWGGILGVIVGVVATGITADTPVGTRLFSWLVWLSLLCFVTNLATVLSLDGPRYLETKVSVMAY